MQTPLATLPYPGDKIQFGELLIRFLVQEDMSNYELSVRQYQCMEQDPTAISSLWQLFKIAKAHNLKINELLDLD